MSFFTCFVLFVLSPNSSFKGWWWLLSSWIGIMTTLEFQCNDIMHVYHRLSLFTHNVSVVCIEWGRNKSTSYKHSCRKRWKKTNVLLACIKGYGQRSRMDRTKYSSVKCIPWLSHNNRWMDLLLLLEFGADICLNYSTQNWNIMWMYIAIYKIVFIRR